MGEELKKPRVPIKRYTSTDKDRLLQLLHEERAEERCDLVHQLTVEREQLTKVVDKEIEELDKKNRCARN